MISALVGLLIGLCLQSWTFPNTQQALRDSQLRWLHWPSWKAEAVVVWVNVCLAKKWLSSQISTHELADHWRGAKACVVSVWVTCLNVVSARRRLSVLCLSLGGCLLGCRCLAEVVLEGVPEVLLCRQGRSVCLSATTTPLCALKIACYNTILKIIGFGTLYGFRYF